VTSEFSGDVMDVLGQLFEAGATALEDEDVDTARQTLTSAETVATNKLPEGEFRSRLRDGCRRALAILDDDVARRATGDRTQSGDDALAAAEHCRAMAREVDTRR